MFVITLFLFTRSPSGFLPIEDQGTELTAVQAPPGATRERTEGTVAQVKAFYRDQEIVDNTFIIRGFSFFGQGQANAMMFTTLKPWGERKGSENSSVTLVGKANGAFIDLKSTRLNSSH